MRATASVLAATGLIAAGTLVLRESGASERAGAEPVATASSTTIAKRTALPVREATSTTVANDPTDAAPAAPASGPAYRLAAADGGIFTHGWYAHEGSGTGLTSSAVTGLAQTRDGEGYWLSSADGGVFAFGTASFYGSAANQASAPIVDIATATHDDGYWLASRDGGVFTFGSATFHGALVDQRLNSPIVSIAATPTGDGYWLVASDGGVFAFGDAAFLGGTAGNHLGGSIISIVPSVTGNGYWLVGADGGVFAFGDAPYFGSLAGQRVNSPIADMAAESSGRGYWIVSRDGGVFAFGDAPFLGSPADARLNAPVIGIAGGVGHDAPAPAPAPVVEAPPAAAPAPAPSPAPASPKPLTTAADGKAKAGPQMAGQQGWDISYPQCGGVPPAAPFGFGVVGVNGGKMFKHNPCLAEQWQWARTSEAAGIYLNVNFPANPIDISLGETSVRQPSCNGSLSCIAYNYGFNGVTDALGYARAQGVDAPFAWLDVETVNYWTADRPLNAVVLRGAIDGIRAAGLEVGVYSTPYQFNRVSGGEPLGVPVWSAGAPGWEPAAMYCVARGFGGGPVVLVQLLPGQYDPNFACAGAGPMSRYFATH